LTENLISKKNYLQWRETNFLKSCLFGWVFLLFFLFGVSIVKEQLTFPKNGMADPRLGNYVFTNVYYLIHFITGVVIAVIVLSYIVKSWLKKLDNKYGKFKRNIQ